MYMYGLYAEDDLARNLAAMERLRLTTNDRRMTWEEEKEQEQLRKDIRSGIRELCGIEEQVIHEAKNPSNPIECRCGWEGEARNFTTHLQDVANRRK